MEIRVIYDGPLAAAAKNLSQTFTGGQFLYFDPHLPPDPNTGAERYIELGVSLLAKVPIIGGEKLVLWDDLGFLNSDLLIPIPREVSESGYEFYLGIGTSIDEPQFTAYVIYSTVTQETLAADLDSVKTDLDSILENQTTAFNLDFAIAANQIAQNTALGILGTGLAPITAGVSAGVLPVLTASPLLLLPGL
jgi:hypothetical protein